MRKAREAKAKAEDEFAERVRDWDMAKLKDRAEIPIIAYKAREKAEFKARERNNFNAVNKAAVEAATMIWDSEKIQGAKRQGEEAEARDKD